MIPLLGTPVNALRVIQVCLVKPTSTTVNLHHVTTANVWTERTHSLACVILVILGDFVNTN